MRDIELGEDSSWGKVRPLSANLWRATILKKIKSTVEFNMRRNFLTEQFYETKGFC